MRHVLLVAAVMALTGCAQHGLVELMQARGISHETTGKIVLRGSEADVGPDIEYDLNTPVNVQEIWDTIYQSRPYTVWFASGYRELDFYGGDDDPKPTLTLLVNASGAAHIEGTDMRFRCPGLEPYVTKLLEKEAARRKRLQATVK